MAEMVGLAEQVDPVVCSTGLEAEVRELRLIAEHSPRYNRRSKRPDKATWIKLTTDAFPRLSLVRKVLADSALYLGPFSRAATAELAVAAVHEALPLRQCTKRISVRTPGSACVLAEMRRCGAPCLGPAAGESVAAYEAHAQAFRTAVAGNPAAVVERLTARIAALSAAHRFEDAAAQRDRLTAFVRATARLQRLTALTRVPQLVAARPTADLGWEIAVVRHGRLVAAGIVARGVRPWAHRRRADRHRRDGAAPPRSAAGGDCRGGRVRSALAGGARDPAGAARGAPGPPLPSAPAAARPGSRPRRTPARRSGPSTTGADCGRKRGPPGRCARPASPARLSRLSPGVCWTGPADRLQA
jgi:DNA polymerase-3 subunit epsilon